MINTRTLGSRLLVSSAEYVKAWRRNTKDRIIKAMGGRCAICAYDTSPEAFDLHHLDPMQKDFNFGGVRRNPKKWVAIVEELRKCVLLCCRCHREVHAGMTAVPSDHPRFDEAYVDYRALEAPQDNCPVCAALKPKVQITCSASCAAKRANRFDWGDHDLIEMRKTMNWSQIARIVGCSDVAARKRWDKLMKQGEDDA